MNTKPQARHDGYELNGCPVEATLELIGGKWKGMILFHLLDGCMRFSELKRHVGGVTQRMLTKQLRELEGCGLVKRTVYAEVPPRVEYELTEKGRTLRPVVSALKQWGQQHGIELLTQDESSAVGE